MKKKTLLILTLALVLTLCACGQKTPTWQEQYDLGVRYLSEGNYEEAIIAFTAAIEIDPKNAEAYLGRANAYMNSETTEDSLSLALSDYEMVLSLDEVNADAYLSVAEIYIARGELDKAEEMLRTGLDKTGDARLSARLEDLVGGNISDYWGRSVRESTYDASGTLLYYLEYSYLTGGRSWKYDTAASYDGSGNQTGYVKCEYDKNERAIRDFYRHGDGKLQYVRPLLCTYDANGNEVRSDWLDADGSLYQYTLSEYDSVGNRIRWSVYEPDGSLRQENVTEYSERGLPIKETVSHYSEVGRYNYRITEFNADGQEIRQTEYDQNGVISCYWTSEYDENGQLLSQKEYNSEGNLSHSYIRRYDENGKYLGRDEYDGEGNLIQSTVVE